MDLAKIAKKWQKEWEKNKVFEADASPGKKKFMLTFPYPYMNGYLHIGHTYTLMRVEALARFKRMQGFNVLFPQGWHATGSPLATAAKRVEEKEKKQIEILKMMGFKDKEIAKFSDPTYWVKVFKKAATEDYKGFGISIDWRRSFVTTDINPRYSKFIQWQFTRLKQGGYIEKGSHPVVWCPKENTPIGDHARAEGEGETPKDFVWVKFRLRDSDLILMAGTTRPDALLGQTNLWLDPKATYNILQVEDEKWVVGKEAVKKVKDQFKKVKEIGTIKSIELFGKWVQGPLMDNEIYIVPASFIDAKVGSGIVYSALEDPVDLMELKKLQSDPKIMKKFNLDEKVVAKLKPIYIIDVPGMGENLGEDIRKEFKVKSDQDKAQLEKAKGELNKRVFRKGIMKNNCGKYAGMPVKEAIPAIKNDLLKAKEVVMFYELSGKVVCRCLTPCIVKMVSNQWFIRYGEPEWKKKAMKCLEEMNLYPEKVRSQFEHVIDWLRDWACTREYGLGTKLPWDKKWLIESLSDSTIYNAYYTISHILDEIPVQNINDDIFDYVFLGKKHPNDVKIDKKILNKMKQEFEYWYPVDFRNSGKDLVQNHLTFYIFNHTAIFPEKFWPKGIGVNGFVSIEAQKMSKSKGVFKTLRDLYTHFTPDVTRMTVLSNGEELSDVNWDSDNAFKVKQKLEQFYDFCLKNYGKGDTEFVDIDKWMESQLNVIINDATEAMEKTFYRTAIMRGYYDLQKDLKWYLRRKAGKFNQKLMKKIIEVQLKLLAPFTPHVCEEIWHKLGNDSFISLEKWPEFDKKKVNPNFDAFEATIVTVMDDIASVLKLAKIDKPKKVRLFVAQQWKYDFYKKLRKVIANTRNVGEIIKEMMKDAKLKKYGKDISKMIPRLVKDPSKIPDVVLNQEAELKFFEDSVDFFKKEIGCLVEIIKEEDSKEGKARQAMPGKPAILLE